MAGMMGTGASGGKSQLDALIELQRDPEAAKRLEELRDNATEAQVALQKERQGLQEDKDEIAKREAELADSYAVLETERRLLTEDAECLAEDKAAHVEAQTALDAQRGQQAEIQAEQIRKGAELARRENDVEATEVALKSRMDALASKERAMDERITRVVDAWQG